MSLRISVPTTVLFSLRVRPEVEQNLVGTEQFRIEPGLPFDEYTDPFGNRCGRVAVPAGVVRFRNNAIVRDSGEPDEYAPGAPQHEISGLPVNTLPFLLPSRYCEEDSELQDLAWKQFSAIKGGWARVQAICDYVHERLKFNYLGARANRTALEAWNERTGVCRDFAHLAITLCRAMNIPAAYATGYMGDIGIPPQAAAMDFSAWFEVFLGGSWYTFDARHNRRRIGRIVMARGRDACDVPLTTVFGSHVMEDFEVVTEEVVESCLDVEQDFRYSGPSLNARSDVSNLATAV